MWRLSVDPKTGKTRKIPFYIDGTSRRAHGSPEDIGKLASFDDAIEVFGKGGFTGIGAAQTGSRVFVQLERGGEGLSAGQGDGRGDQAFLEKGSCHSVLSL